MCENINVYFVLSLKILGTEWIYSEILFGSISWRPSSRRQRRDDSQSKQGHVLAPVISIINFANQLIGSARFRWYSTGIISRGRHTMHSLPQQYLAFDNIFSLPPPSLSLFLSLSHAFLKILSPNPALGVFPFSFLPLFFCARQVFSLAFRVLRIALSRFNLLSMHKALCGEWRHRRTSRRVAAASSQASKVRCCAPSFWENVLYVVTFTKIYASTLTLRRSTATASTIPRIRARNGSHFSRGNGFPPPRDAAHTAAWSYNASRLYQHIVAETQDALCTTPLRRAE